MAELTEQAVRDALRDVIDPELGANVVDLGMVKQIGIIGDLVSVKLVLTSPDCPLAGWIVTQARRAVAALPGVADVQVEVLDEPWDPNGASDDWQSWVNTGRGRG